jgi:hypothetical protein
MAPKKSGTDILSAVSAVHEALKGLTPAERAKVVSSVRALLEIAPSTAIDNTAPPDASQTAASRTETVPRTAPGRPVSLIELMQEKQPRTNVEKIALFAYYREKYEGKPRFARADLEGYFAKARELPPANFDRDFANTVKNAWIHEDADQSYITSKGIEAVESAFPAQRKRSKETRAKAIRKSRSKGA